MVYDDLIISIKRADTDRYQAIVQQRGVLIQSVLLGHSDSFSAREVQLLRHSYAQAVDALHVLAPLGIPVPPPDTERLLDLGRRVAAILPERTRLSIVWALARARRRRRGLRITLEVAADACALLSVPWELIALSSGRVDGGLELPLLLQADVALVRQIQGAGRSMPLVFARPLRLQAFAAQPLDAAPIDIEPVAQALQPMLAGGAAELFTAAGTLQAMQERVQQRAPQIIHLLCHGEASDTGRQMRYVLQLTHPDGYTQRVGLFDLVPTLLLTPDLRLVLLDACHGAALLADQERAASENIALGLIRVGVPMVIAVQGEVSQASSGAFSRAFYAGLAAGLSVEQAVTQGRIAMQAAGGVVDWSLPVIYRGSEQPEPRTIFAVIADGIEMALYHPLIFATLRAGMVALAVLLIVAGLMRWLLLPLVPLHFDVLQLERALLVWTGAGLIGPAVIAATHRGVRDCLSLPRRIRSLALISQWAAAFLGYAIWGLVGLALCVALHILGLLRRLPDDLERSLIGVVVLGALLMSYTAARAQVKAVVLLAPQHPELFGLKREALIIVRALVLLCVPAGAIHLAAWTATWVVEPITAAVVLALALITTVLFDRG